MKKVLLCSLIILFAGLDTTAQQNNIKLMPAPSIEDFFKNQEIQAEQKTKLMARPTGLKQRMVFSTFTRIDPVTLAHQIIDSTFFLYGGTVRGAYPTSATGLSNTVVDYDTCFSYNYEGGFINQGTKSSKKYDSDNRLLSEIRYYSNNSLNEKFWYEYHADGNTKTNGNLRYYTTANTDWTYKELKFNTAGKVTNDTFSQYVPYTAPAPDYNWHYSIVYEFDAAGRVNQSRRVNYLGNTTTTVSSNFKRWFFYNGNSEVPYKDSGSLVQGSVTTIHERLYTYNAQNKVLREVIIYRPSNDTSSKTEYIYDANGNVLQQLNVGYSNNQWLNANKDVYTYFDNILTSRTATFWEATSSAWSTPYVTQYSLNDDQLVDTVSTLGSGFLNSLQTFTYNGFGNQTKREFYNLDTLGNLFAGGITHFYYVDYDDGLNIGDKDNKQNSIHIYPNPSNDVLRIQVTNTTESYNYSIVSLNGKLIQSSNSNQHETTIDISNLPSGVYFLKASNQKGLIVKKFVKR